MKKIILAFGLLFFNTAILFAQEGNDYAIYDTLLKKYPKRVPVAEINLQPLKRIDFSKLNEYDLNPKDTLNKSWTEFVNNIDTSNIQTKSLDSSFLEKYPKQASSKSLIMFTPVIYSPDNTKAICATYLFGKGSSSEALFLFEKKNNAWMFRKYYLVYMYD